MLNVFDNIKNTYGSNGYFLKSVVERKTQKNGKVIKVFKAIYQNIETNELLEYFTTDKRLIISGGDVKLLNDTYSLTI